MAALVGTLALAGGCSDSDGDAEAVSAERDAEPNTNAEAEAVPPPEPEPEPDPIEAVADCQALAARSSPHDRVIQSSACPGLSLGHGELRQILLQVASAPEAAALIPALDRNAELQGLVRLAALDRASQPLPSELPDPATALLTPVDDRILAAVELAHAQLRDPAVDETSRTRAHAFLARVYIQALQTLGLPPGRPLPPFARLLAGPALHHGRSFCRFYWQRRVAGLERAFAQTELDLLTLVLDLENTPHAGDPALLAVERQRSRVYLQREGPSARIARRARSRPEAGALGTDLLLPFVHELDRLFDHRFIDLAVERAMKQGAASRGYGLDPVVAVVTEDLRSRDLREYERRLARRVERARRSTPSSRHEAGARELEPELPTEWPDAARVAQEARAWLALAHGRGPDFTRAHARARAVLALRLRPDAVVELLGAGPEDEVVAGHVELLFTLLERFGDDDLQSLRLRVDADWPRGEDPQARADRARRSYALATRDALLHPR